MISDRWIDNTLAVAKERVSDLQPWQDYFESKARELKTILRFCGEGDAHSILEIGCGNGFTAALLSEKARRVEAFDLPLKDPTNHSIGINVAKDLVRRLGINNVHVVGGSAEMLPFEGGSFQLIFSEYALQYVKDKEKALEEMRRVLSDNGRIVMVVPNFMERVFNPVMKYKYIAKRFFGRLIKSGSPAAMAVSQAKAADGLAGDTSNALASLAEQLLLRPDGAYKSFSEEMLSHTPASWKRLFERKGFKVVRTFSTQILPLGVFDLLGAPAMRLMSRSSHSLNNMLGNLPGIKSIGYSVGMVIVKDRM